MVTEGGGGPALTRYVCGFLGCDSRPFNPLLGALPRLMRIPRVGGAPGDLLDRLIELTLAEAPAQRPGAECVRLRLSELMFVEVVRRYLETLPPEQTGWLAGLRDPAVGRAVALVHENPAHDWTIEELARETGLLRQRGKVGSHLFCLNAGLRIVPRERRKSPLRTTRLLAVLDAFAETASAGLKELDRLALANSQMERRLRNRRKSSSLPALIELVLARPVVSAGLIAAELKISQRAALGLVAELGIREVTGRGRYRAWGLL